MNFNRNFWRLCALMIVVTLVGAACTDGPSGTAPRADSMLPQLTGYTTLDVSTIQEYIVGLGETGTALTGQFAATAAIEAVDRVVGCYQEIGAVAARGYSKDALPIVAGVVAIVNRDLLTDPQTFLACVGLAQPDMESGQQGGGGLVPCGFSYSTELEGDTFDMLYAGTDIEVCQAFCRSLPNCVGHP